MNRRTFLTINGFGLASLGLPTFSFSKEELPKNEKSIIWIYLGGGATVPELFNSRPDAPIEYRSVTGTINTKVHGMRFGGGLSKLSGLASDFTVVQSFHHNNNDHNRATAWVNTGYYPGNNEEQKGPSIGSIISNIFGPINVSGLPVYMVDGRMDGDKASYLGSANQPFDVNSGASRNFTAQTNKERLLLRGNLLNALDRFHKDREEINNLTKVKNQAIDIVLGKASQAFDLKLENPKTVEFYGDGLGKKLLLARRLTEYGVKFVSVNFGGWDMHSDIKQGVDRLVPQLDQALFSLLTDLKQSGRIQNTMVIVTSEFGRTPKINAQNGRDHWSGTNNLLIAGGGYEHGRVIGNTDDKVSEITDNPFQPLDLMRTIFDYYGIDHKLQKTDLAGRPRYLIDGESKNILI